ncbi:MAG: PAS domain-containing protein [Chloroflexi bacterium]|nr:PAS domain-containing protein [Chloroflexota bacterium]
MSEKDKATTQLVDELATLRQRVQLLDAVLNSLPLDIFVKDTENRLLFVNVSGRHGLGIAAAEDYIGKTDFDFKSQEQAAKCFADEQTIIQTGEPLLNQEQSGTDPDGRMCWSLSSKLPLRDSQGVIMGIVEISQDISERKRSDEVLIRERNLMRIMIDSMPDSLYATDRECRYLLANLTFLRRRGLKRQEDLIGKTAYDFMEPALAEVYMAEDRAVMSTGQAQINREIQLTSRADKPWRSYTKAPWRDERGEISGLVVHTRDITENKRAEAERVALAVEREKMRILAKFIEDVSHEFRTPLSAINVKAYMLGRAQSPEAQARLLASLEEQSSYIGELVDALLMMARLDSNAEFASDRIDWIHTLSEIENSCRSQAEKKQVSLSVALEDDLPSVQGDDEKLCQGLFNIVKNAIQYTPTGGSVSVYVYLQGDHVVIDVMDTGIGISADDLAHIFDRFFRVDKARTERGAGLGLSIAKKIVEAHGGRIEVKSVLGGGSTFRVLLPIESTTS